MWGMQKDYKLHSIGSPMKKQQPYWNTLNEWPRSMIGWKRKGDNQLNKCNRALVFTRARSSECKPPYLASGGHLHIFGAQVEPLSGQTLATLYNSSTVASQQLHIRWSAFLYTHPIAASLQSSYIQSQNLSNNPNRVRLGLTCNLSRALKPLSGWRSNWFIPNLPQL